MLDKVVTIGGRGSEEDIIVASEFMGLKNMRLEITLFIFSCPSW